MSTGVFLILFGTIYGLGAFAFYDHLVRRHSVRVDDNDYPIKAKVIPFPARDRKRKAA